MARRIAAALVAVLCLAAAAPAGADEPASPPPGAWTIAPRLDVPEDQYAMAGGCYSVEGRSEPFHFQAVDLGRYLLYSPDRQFLGADGGRVVLVDAPSPATEWEATALGDGRFVLRNPERGAQLVGVLHLSEGCAAYPDIDTGVTGPVATGTTSYEQVTGYLDSHLHVTAYEFLGGRLHCGEPWNRYGVAYALQDCPDHALVDGNLAVIEDFLSYGAPLRGHDSTGWPKFTEWPEAASQTHEQTYFRWLERAWRGGLRTMVNLLVENRVLCTLYPYKENSCDEMDAVRLQATRIRELERYIDAQSGGPGEGWFRIVTDPFTAREVINQGRLAVILGIEVSEPFGCGVIAGVPQCTEADIDASLDELDALGVRQLTTIHKFDNALGGVKGDSGAVGTIINGGNFIGTGRFWDMDTCDPAGTGEHDSPQSLVTGGEHEAEIFTTLLDALEPEGELPIYPRGNLCNSLGLTPLGEHAVDGMMQRDMIIDVDHMSLRSRDDALDRIEAAEYGGVVSSHSWASDDSYRRVLQLGGVVSPYAGGSFFYANTWERLRPMADPRYHYGLGYGADSNGLGAQGAPRGALGDAPPIEYPFTGFGGTTIDRQVSGERTFDVNVDGVAQYGLYPDWIEDLRQLKGDQIVRDLEQGPEAYLQMWERAVGIQAPGCLEPAEAAALRPGLTPREVLAVAGQPTDRVDATFDYCGTILPFDADGRLSVAPVVAAAAAAPVASAVEELPATGRTSELGPAALALALGLVLLARRHRFS